MLGTPQTPSTPKSLSNARLLIIDDSRTFCSLLRSIMRDVGLRDITDIVDPFLALEFLRTNPVDCITLDYVMPGMDGIRLVRALRADPDSLNRLTPIILITGHADMRLIKEAVDTGIDEVLVKPLRPATFIQRLTSTIQKPRDCVATASGYVGPERRRLRDADYQGSNRRLREDHALISREALFYPPDEGRPALAPARTARSDDADVFLVE